MENLNAQFVSAITTPWGLLDLLNAASEAGKTVLYRSFCKAIPWDDAVVTARFESSVKALESNKLIKMATSYPNGMSIEITEAGKAQLSPTWRTHLNDEFKRVDSKEKAPLGVPVQMLNLRGVAITDEILNYLNAGVVSQANAADKSIGKILSDAWKTDAAEITHEQKPTVMGWRYREDAFVMVHTPENNSLFKLTADAALAIFGQAVPSIAVN